MADENTNQDNTERDQKIKEEYDELIRRGTHDTASATNALSIQYRLSSERIHAIVGPQPKPEEDRDAHASQERQVRRDD